MEDITAIQNGKVGKGLKQFLTDEVLGKGKGKESLVVIDPHLGSVLFFSHLSKLNFLFFQSFRTFNHEKTEHKCQRYGGRSTCRSLAWYQKSDYCSP